ncbi:MAG: hypothetical protein RBR86_06810 [Pseudobdellovibrionaceae bacterium]|jgi:CDP-4-dehydro-6-deoxyglucose reductase/ferredoxin-NAD(P)+ reductase (naphthalene dioxygenase ferredoxin-specific)|nr:hypothetical protein [Pseudobdellovibrionaceae bacterium]
MITFQARLVAARSYPLARVRVLRFSPLDAETEAFPLHRAGAYALVTFPGHSARPYSVANISDGHILEFHIRLGQSGVSKYVEQDLTIGDIVSISGYGGSCLYAEDCKKPVLLIGGGTGLAPLLAISEAALAEAPSRSVTLYLGGRHRDDFYLNDFLNDLAARFPAFNFYPVLSRTDKTEDEDGYLYGMVGDVAFSHFENSTESRKSRIYTSGPVEMLRQVHELALSKGFHPDYIHSDLTSFQAENSAEQEHSP